MKGKCELNLKAFSVNFTKEIVGFLNRKNLNYLKKQNDEDKDLQNYKVYFNNMKQMAESLILNIEMLLELKEGDLKSLEKFEIASNEFSINNIFHF